MEIMKWILITFFFSISVVVVVETLYICLPPLTIRISVFAAILVSAQACLLIYRPDCSIERAGSFHPHETNCNLFYRCDENGIATVYSCPKGTRYLNLNGYICVSEERIKCNRCVAAHAKCGDCGCSQTTPQPCVTTTPSPNATDSTTSVTPTVIDTTTTNAVTTTKISISTTTAFTVTITPDCSVPTNCTEMSPESVHPYPSNCSKYIYCDDNHKPLIAECAVNYEFSPVTLECLPAEEANCPICIPNVTPTPTSSPSALCPPVPYCDVNDVGVTKPYPPDCSLYIYCDSNFRSVLAKCSQGHHYSPYQLECLPPEEAYCPECSPATSVTAIPECPPMSSCVNVAEGVILPYPPDCTKYMYCDGNDNAILSDCSNGSHFSPIYYTCMDPELAECPYCVDKYTTLQPTTERIPGCSPPPQCEYIGAVLPYPADCTKYVYCEDLNNPVLANCPVDLHFSPSAYMCMAPEEANCPICIVTTPGSTTSTTAQQTTTLPECPPVSSCKDMELGVKLPYPPDCTKYLHCDGNDNAIITACPTGTHFSPVYLICLSPDSAECPLCINTQTTLEPSTTQVPSDCSPSPRCEIEDITHILPYPPDCSKYTYCEDLHKPDVRDCPQGLHFSPYVLNCISPEEADCPICIADGAPTDTTTEQTTTTTEQTTTTAEQTTTELTTTTIETTTTPPKCPPLYVCTNETARIIDMPTKHPYPPDCTKYVYCYDRPEPYIGSCQAGLHFSPTVFDCLTPEEAQCPYCVE